MLAPFFFSSECIVVRRREEEKGSASMSLSFHSHSDRSTPHVLCMLENTSQDAVLDIARFLPVQVHVQEKTRMRKWRVGWVRPAECVFCSRA